MIHVLHWQDMWAYVTTPFATHYATLEQAYPSRKIDASVPRIMHNNKWLIKETNYDEVFI